MARYKKPKKPTLTERKARATELAELLEELSFVIENKFERLNLEYCPLGGRGTLALQVYTGRKTYVHLYETGYRAGIWPRFVWEFDAGTGIDESLRVAARYVLKLERKNKDRMVGRIDKRPSAALELFDEERHARDVQPAPARRPSTTADGSSP